jgi:DHA1 family bicyclomycin/chloramphenicol resistance-like MFS transporter
MKRHSLGFTFLLAAISALTSLAIDMGLPAMPVIEAQFHLLPGRASLTLSVFLAGFALTPLLGGPLSDRLGRRPVLLTGLAVFAASALGCATVPSFAFLLLFRLLQGAAAGVCVAMPLAIIRDTLDGHAARQSMSQVTTILGVVPMLAPIVGSWVLLAASWHSIYALQGALALALLVCVILLFAETLPPAKRQALPAHTLLLNYRHLLHEPVFLLHAFMYALTYACIFAYVSASPVVFMGQMHIPQHIYTLLFACTAGSQLLGALASSLLSRRRLPARTFLRVGLTLLGAASLAAAILQRAGCDRPPYLVVPMMLMMVAFGFMAPSLTVGALEPIPHVAGAGSGAVRSLQMIMGSAASGSLAWLCARTHTNPAITTTTLMTILALTALGLYLVTPRGRGSHPARTGESDPSTG